MENRVKLERIVTRSKNWILKEKVIVYLKERKKQTNREWESD